jgi:nucleotide-binding universal stress UspA family protein
MVHQWIGHPNASVLGVAGDIAKQFGARAIGVGVCQPILIPHTETYIPMEIIEQDRQEIKKELKEAEAQFREGMGQRARALEWRFQVTYGLLSDYVASEARCADLIITGVDPKLAWLDGTRHVAASDLFMQCGRPVLIVPPTVTKAAFNRVIVGWRDTREARRATADALPFLKAAKNVTIVEIARADDMDSVQRHLADVVGWLDCHGVKAESLAVAAKGDDAEQLGDIAHEKEADFLVAGGYGHSRVREWVLGGVTRDLLLCADRCTLVSH